MTLTIDLSEDQRTTLQARAKAQGASTEQYVRHVLEQDLAPEWLRKSWRIAEQNGTSKLSTEEIDTKIAAARQQRRGKNIQPGS